MKKSEKKDYSEYVDMDLAFLTMVQKWQITEKMQAFVKKHKIIGNLKWVDFEKLDKEFADEYRAFIEKNKARIEEKYTSFGANRRYLGMKKESDKIAKNKMLPKSGNNTKRGKSQKQENKIFSQDNIEDLLNLKTESLTLRQVKKILDKGKLDYTDFEPYYRRYQELKSKPINYNKPPHIRTAKSLITKVFSGKANPSIWLPYEEIIKSKLYSIKMGIQYLEKADPKILEQVLSEYQSKIDDLLKELKYNDINEIKF